MINPAAERVTPDTKQLRSLLLTAAALPGNRLGNGIPASSLALSDSLGLQREKTKAHLREGRSEDAAFHETGKDDIEKKYEELRKGRKKDRDNHCGRK